MNWDDIHIIIVSYQGENRFYFTINKQFTGGSPALCTRFQEYFLFPWSPDGQMIMMLHAYRQRRFQRTWFGVNQPSGCWVPASARFQEPLSCLWVHQWCHHGLMPMILRISMPTVPMNFIWSESANEWLSYSIRKIPGALITPIGMPVMPPWVNNHGVAAHLQTKTLPMNLIWSESA